MRWFRFAALILTVTILQKGVLARWDNKPDLLLIALVFSATYLNTSDAIISSFIIGFAADLVGSPIPMGPHMISFGVFGTLLAYLNRVIAIRRLPYQALAIFVMGILAGVLTHVLAGESLSRSMFAVVLVTSLYSGFVGPFLVAPSAWWIGIRTGRLRRR
ncbi:MAG TPA: rod shape-determining protein MreD [Sedimentisphaerales bacterium]|nr:rod shape-determining protein MreD [Sedimentisphaerales bacterium]